jgi:hypothetical protein
VHLVKRPVGGGISISHAATNSRHKPFTNPAAQPGVALARRTAEPRSVSDSILELNPLKLAGADRSAPAHVTDLNKESIDDRFSL